jgi:SAM-dependent methyltransferase
MSGLAQHLFHLICIKDYQWPSEYLETAFQHGIEEKSAQFFQRLGNQIDFVDKTVLDVGCGSGSTCVYMARHGARHVVGIDIDTGRIRFAQTKLASESSDVANKVEFKVVSAPNQLSKHKFDIILSKDSFEHIAHPQEYLQELQEYIADNGLVVIGFGPLWKSPWGGHIKEMTKVPWAHLLFPEKVVLAERRRLFHPPDQVETYEQTNGGLNKMTLKKFFTIMKKSRLEPIYFQTNVHDRPLAKIFDVLRRIPFCEEYFTFNVYSIWRLRPT